MLSLRLTLQLIFLFAFIPVFGQGNDVGATIIKIADGVLWAHNKDGANFVLEIKGSRIEEAQNYLHIRVDGRPMQIRIVPIKNFLNITSSRPKDSEILKAHQDWEIVHHSKLLEASLKPRSENLRIGANREALFWDYQNPPEMRQEFAAQSFLTTAFDKHLLVINTPLHIKEEQNAARNFLIATASTLQVSATPIDIKELQVSIRSNGGRSNGDKTPSLGQPVISRVLFIGNSYTYFNNLPQIVAGLAASETPQRRMEAAMVAVGGATLKRLWETGEALEAIKRGGWHYVVLQEQSTLGAAPVVDGIQQIADPQTFHEYARLFDAEIKKTGAKTIFYLTWARQNTPEKQSLLTEAYQKIAKELKAAVAPVGIAWERALKGNERMTLHSEDKSHPAPAGSYLAACVIFATIYGKSPEGLSAQITGAVIDNAGKVSDGQGDLIKLSKEDAAFLQKIASEVAQKTRQ